MSHPLQATLEDRDGRWVLSFTRDLGHPVEAVWPWLTEPERLRRWSPVVPDRRFDSAGPAEVRENPGDDPVDGTVVTVDAPRELVHRWGPDLLRWRLEPTETGCRLTLEHQMAERDHEAENAGGWHICLDVLASNLDGANPERLVGEVVMDHGFPELRDGYRKLLGV
ncbi:SRPBCC family protein [Mycobacterium sp.]|jgi:uncharacterized protein YndB with AHSA1/START domain|uniref:SRPBCC family protein n=1 Tax=Mycobacterium sp. TaxID=1785 RepID=UPI002F0A1DF0